MSSFSSVQHNWIATSALPDYHLTLQQYVQVLEAINRPHIPTLEEQVLQFIIGMNSKYSAYSQHIQYDMIEGVAAPATTAEAEHEEVHWKQGDIQYQHTRATEWYSKGSI